MAVSAAVHVSGGARHRSRNLIGPSYRSTVGPRKTRGMRGAERAPRLKHKKWRYLKRPARLLSPRLVRSSGRSAHASRKEQPKVTDGPVPASFSRCPKSFSPKRRDLRLRRRRRPAYAPPVKPCNIGQSAPSGARADPSEGCRAGSFRCEPSRRRPPFPQSSGSYTDPHSKSGDMNCK